MTTSSKIATRVRKLVNKSNNSENYVFTLKVSTNGRCVEIEKNIDKRDFDDLWAIALNKLEKIRYVISHEKMNWEIDFFKNCNGETYLAVAEIELPENGTNEPESLLNLVKENLLFEVPLNDTRFSNKLLGDASYVVKVLEEIKRK